MVPRGSGKGSIAEVVPRMIETRTPIPALDVRSAAVREVSGAFGRLPGAVDGRVRVDPGRAARQHRAYVAFLREAGIAVTVLPPVERSAESPFVEDLALVLGPRHAILCRPESPVRAREEDGIRNLLIGSREVLDLSAGVRFHAGDAVRAGDVLYLAVGSGTDAGGADFVERAAALERLKVVRIPAVRGRPPLGRLCAPLGGEVILHAAGALSRGALPGVEMLAAPEAAGVNVLVLPDRVLVPEEAPRTAALLDHRGFRVTVLPLSEFLAAGAGPSRLSVRW